MKVQTWHLVQCSNPCSCRARWRNWRVERPTVPWHWAPRGSSAPPAEERCQFSPQHQYVHCHPQTGRRLPSMHQIRCLYRWDGATGSETVAAEGTVTAHESSSWKGLNLLWLWEQSSVTYATGPLQFHLPAGQQTRVETGSYYGTSWTMSMSGFAGSQPVMKALRRLETHYSDFHLMFQIKLNSQSSKLLEASSATLTSQQTYTHNSK